MGVEIVQARRFETRAGKLMTLTAAARVFSSYHPGPAVPLATTVRTPTDRSKRLSAAAGIPPLERPEIL